jgi:glycosyltransferase involved in cell wall biosynthesis
MSKDDQKKILKLLPNLNTAILPNGVDTNYFTKIEGELEDKITFLGGLSHPPNLTALRYFLKSIYPYIKREFPKFRFLILGNPGEVNPEEFIIDSQIEHLGFVEDSRPYLSNSIFIAPLLSGSGTRLKILEAMSLECPVVATPIACEGITAENYKDIIIADNPKDFAREVVNLLKNKELRREIGKNARSLVVEKYDWKIVGEKYEEILKELTSKK